jgi:hypothetical protein
MSTTDPAPPGSDVGDDLDVPPDDVLGGDTSEEEPPTER